MAIEDILKYVDGETAAKCEKIVAEARAAAAETAAAAREEMGRLSKECGRRSDMARRASEEHHLRRARMAARDASLAVRREILDDLYADIFKKISSSDSAKIPLYEKLLDGLHQSASAELVTSAAESEIWSRLKKRVKHSKASEGNFASGFIYRTADASWDFTLENIFADFRAKTQSEAAFMIFETCSPEK
ncbi:MAG: hypothetical protein CVU77_00585 [Elusimicrobia bacterium HGW-Elusimicrobia-1]|jgi:vacuolar-type H+-ATPase subunit E/Vma4|nr:MAG: hypothetical protein CVU77_00585 [Elusimicrobia bacterium HGW-Elusimicrobia-1]